ncbi:MAG: hypothetical protein H0U76_30010 [Ktedonobacteraceae bacterium]|nr:hypothetical protein [Ktedonobacteraceae bacterium]
MTWSSRSVRERTRIAETPAVLEWLRSLSRTERESHVILTETLPPDNPSLWLFGERKDVRLPPQRKRYIHAEETTNSDAAPGSL